MYENEQNESEISQWKLLESISQQNHVLLLTVSVKYLKRGELWYQKIKFVIAARQKKSIQRTRGCEYDNIIK